MPERSQRLVLISLVTCLAMVLVLLFFYRPFWGLIDDGNILNSLSEMRKVGLWQTTLANIQGDLKWGMIRPYLPAMYLFLYGWNPANPLITQVLNFCWTIAAHWLFFFALLRSPTGGYLRGFLARGNKVSAASGATLMTLMAFSFTWFHYYFALPSLQEKVVVSWAAASLWALSSPTVRQGKFYVFFLAALLISLVGALSKAQFVFFWPVMISALWERGPLPWKRASLLTLLFGAGSAALKFLAARGSYTATYGLSAIFENLHESKSAPLFFGLILLYGFICLSTAKKEKAENSLLAALLAPAVGLGIFVILMLPWKLGGYLNAISTPFLAMMLGYSLLWLSRFPRIQQIALFSVIILALSTTAYRERQQFEAFGSLRQLIEKAKSGRWPEEASHVWNSCNEGSGHIEKYLNWFGGQEVRVSYADPAAPSSITTSPAARYIYWIEEPSLCPVVPSRQYDLGSKTLLLGENSANSFQLVRYNLNKQK